MEVSPVHAALLLVGFACVVWAKEQVVIVDGADPAIRLLSPTSTDGGASWATINRGEGCDTPQHLTRRIGDQVNFAFVGTAVFVVGTTGPEGGVVTVDLDGQSFNVDRTSQVLGCDQTLFQKLNLPFVQHTLVTTFTRRKNSSYTGKEDGLFSIQRIRYTIPLDNGPSVPIAVIAGSTVGGVAFGTALFALFFLFRRRKRKVKKTPTNQTPIDSNPKGSPSQTTPSTYNGFSITPFVWTGPGSQHHLESHSREELPHPSPGVTALPLQPMQSTPSPPISGSSSSQSRQTLATKPSPTAPQSGSPSRIGGNETQRPNVPRRQSSSLNDDALVERIAVRLADIMSSRGVHPSMPPPTYEGTEVQGRDPNSRADLQRRIQQRVQVIRSEQGDHQPGRAPVRIPPPLDFGSSSDLKSPTDPNPSSPRSPTGLYPPLLQRHENSYSIDYTSGYPLDKPPSSTTPVSPYEQALRTNSFERVSDRCLVQSPISVDADVPSLSLQPESPTRTPEAIASSDSPPDPSLTRSRP